MAIAKSETKQITCTCIDVSDYDSDYDSAYGSTPEPALRTFARKFSNIDFFLRLLPLKVDELVMSEL